MPEGPKEGWTNAQSERINKDYQPESLTVIEHLLVYLQPKATRAIPKKNTKAIPRDIPAILILPNPNPTVHTSERTTTACRAEGMLNSPSIQFISYHYNT